MLSMTPKQKEILEALKTLYAQKNEPIGPTEIGLYLGKEYQSASSYCASTLKKLTENCVVEKFPGGKYIPMQSKVENEIKQNFLVR